jgi:hypothetical protein
MWKPDFVARVAFEADQPAAVRTVVTSGTSCILVITDRRGITG